MRVDQILMRVAVPREHFEGIKEVVTGPVTWSDNRRATLASATVTCQKGGATRCALGCVACAHVVSVRPDASGTHLLVRCLWTEADPVKDLMTLAPAAVTVPADMLAEVADEVARARGVRHLLVMRDDVVVGVVCRCDLVPPLEYEEVVAERMTATVLAVGLDATIGETASLMHRRGVGLLFVMDGDELAGVITRGDLRRAGVPEALLGAHFCASCGGTQGVCSHPRQPGGVEFCLDCLDKAAAVDDELGEGD